MINVREVRFTPLKGDGDVGFVPNRRLMHGSKELKLFDHFSEPAKVRGCSLSR